MQKDKIRITLPKIRYRLCFNYANRLNHLGMSSVAIECRQGRNRLYLKSNIMLFPHQWADGRVVNHENADKLTVYLVRWMNAIESIELDALLQGRSITLRQLKDAVKTGVHCNATLRQFVETVIWADSSRCLNTKRSYQYLVNDMEKYFGNLYVSDISYDLIVRFRENMRRRELSENTVKGKLKALRCICEEARLRDLIEKNPFDAITIGNMTPRVEYLEEREVHKLERLQLSGKEEIVKDMFLFSCYTGLRFSDLASLEEAELKEGILIKKMKKTKHFVYIPINTLFWGKGRTIWDKYPDITTLSHAVCNTTFNRMIKEIGIKAGIKKNLHAHLARKTCSNWLSYLGLSVDDISTILGHTETKVTRKHYLFNDAERVQKTVKKLFKKAK